MSKERKGMIDYFKAAFRQKAAAGVPAPAGAVPPTPPPETVAEAYACFEARVAPVLLALKSLPPDEAGLEFFTRIDIVRPDEYPERPDIDPRIDVWLFHTRAGKPASKLNDAPSSHLITIESKKSTPERQDFSQLLALSETPVLRLSFKPNAAEGERLTRHTYIERYEIPQAGKKYSIYCGNYGMVIDKSDERPLARMADFSSEIQGWLKTHAPARLPAVARLLSPPRDIEVLPPINIRKRGPRT